jgi:hypothetical protein
VILFKRVNDAQTVYLLLMLHVFGNQGMTTRFKRGGNN